MAFVTIRLKNVDGFTRSNLAKDRMVLGRASKADIAIKHASISREHCAFVRDGQRWLVEDLGSQNGTWVNKTKVVGKMALQERDIVKAGQARLTFYAGAAEDRIPDDDVDRDASDGAGIAIDIELPDHKSAGINSVGPRSMSEIAPEACACSGCGAWFSIAHRLSGDTMNCPRCGQANIIPSMST